jgi:peptidoglycan/LPS O-acetylase OafA/YrhL
VTKKIPSLDGLRAISIAFVIVGHMAECGLAPKFFELYASFGVHVFFVISGYLITTLLLKERTETGGIDLKSFYLRRALRIFPAAYFFMFVMFLIFRLSARDVLTAVTYLSNYNASRDWVVGHLWSLAVEEQFYLLWPIAMVLFFARRRGILIGTILAVPVANVLLHFAHLSAYVGTAFPSVADSLALGCLAAVVSPNLKSSSFALAAPIALILQALPGSAAVRVLIFWPLIHIFIAVFVLHAVQRSYAYLNIKPLAWIGVLSYSLYLWQQPLLNPSGASWLKVSMILPIAMASYYMVEKPFLKLKNKLARSTQSQLSLQGGV